MPTKSSEVYKCAICGNIVEVLHPAAGQLVCCGSPMTLLDAKSVDASRDIGIYITAKVREALNLQ